MTWDRTRAMDDPYGNFEYAVSFVMKNEGGYSDDPDDAGGTTKYGVSMNLVKELVDLGEINLSPHEIFNFVRDLSKKDAKAIYRKFFWIPNNYGQIVSPDVAAKCLDMSVLFGAGTANRAIQRATRAAVGTELKEDGIIGPRTLNAISCCVIVVLIAVLKSEMACLARSSKARNRDKYIKGWLERAYR